MKFSQTCIRQPVLAIVMSLVLMVVGIIGYQKIDIRFFPKLDIPVVSIWIEYDGASAKYMEAGVVTPIENAISDVSGIDAMSSRSSNSWANINVRFRMDGHFEQEVNDLRDSISGIRDQLPTDMKGPWLNVGGVGPTILNIAFTDDNKSPEEIRDYVDRNIMPVFNQLPGVGWVDEHGAGSYAMRVWLNPDKMAAYGITVTDVENAIESNNIDFPAGSIQDPQRNYSIVSDTRLKTGDEFGNILLSQKNNASIRLKDIADVGLGSDSLQPSPMRINGKVAFGVQVSPMQGANPIDVANSVKTSLEKLKQQLPPGMHTEIIYDASRFLKSSINETFEAIFLAIILVVAVVLLFLGSLRSAWVPIVTIPVCMVSVFGIMNFLGFSINTVSLLAMVLAIGLVVDDAIVVLENIHRHIEDGMAPMAAALKGSKEIGLPVIAMTLTLAAVYAPIGFAEGFTSIIFKEFAFTLAGAVIISGFVALTLSPMMCAKILRPKTHKNKIAVLRYLENGLQNLTDFYRGVLPKLLASQSVIVMGLVVIAALGYLVYRSVPSEFVPTEDTGMIAGSIVSPTGSSFSYTNRYAKQVEQLFKKVPQAANSYVMVNTGSVSTGLNLKPWGQRKLTTEQLVEKLNPELAKIPGINAVLYVPDPVDYGLGGSDIVVRLVTTGSYQDLIEPISRLVALTKGYAGLTDVNSDLKFDEQQFKVTVNRDLASALGVNVQDIADTLSIMLGGDHVTDVQSGTQSYSVLVQMRKADLENFKGIDKLYVRSGLGDSSTGINDMVPLSSLVKLTPIVGEPSLAHYNRMRAATFSARVTPGYTESQAIGYLQQVLPTVLGPNMSYAFDGKAAQFLSSQGNMASMFLMALVFIYLVLAAQFGSFIDPFIILLSVPLSIVFAIVALKLSGGTMSLYANIGLVTLVGMITKHGILITQFTNELREEGQPLMDALVTAASIRLRPILMTTSAMVFGALPLVLVTGPGSVGRHQIGWVIIAGLLFGTFFSLVVVPIAYTFFGKFKTIQPKSDNYLS